MKSNLRKLADYFSRLLDQVLGTVPTLVRANRLLTVKISDKQRKKISSSDPRLSLSEERLWAQLESDFKRLERIEEKARSTVLGVALSVSLATPGILLLTQTEVLADEALVVRVVSVIVLVSAVAFLLTSGYFALSGYKAEQVFRPRLEDYAPLVSSEEARKVILHCIDLNTLRIIQKANLLSASMDCLRNGIVMILFFLLLAALSVL